MRETSVEELMGQFKSIKECAEYYEYEELLDEDFEELTEWELDDVDWALKSVGYVDTDSEEFFDDDFQNHCDFLTNTYNRGHVDQ
jgi:hypothetical protein